MPRIRADARFGDERARSPARDRPASISAIVASRLRVQIGDQSRADRARLAALARIVARSARRSRSIAGATSAAVRAIAVEIARSAGRADSRAAPSRPARSALRACVDRQLDLIGVADPAAYARRLRDVDPGRPRRPPRSAPAKPSDHAARSGTAATRPSRTPRSLEQRRQPSHAALGAARVDNASDAALTRDQSLQSSRSCALAARPRRRRAAAPARSRR